VTIYIPTGFIAPLFIASFILLCLQYYRIHPERRLLNLRFLLMVGALALMFATVIMSDQHLSLVFFLVALFWLGLSVWLLRFMPPPRH
jgi:hypothetical protein